MPDKRVGPPRECLRCGREFLRWRSKANQKYCSKQCWLRTYNTQERNAKIARENRHKISKSRLRLYENSSTWYRKVNGRHEHRTVMEEMLGRPLQPNEIVHHRDGNKRNNDPSNLELMTRAGHFIFHVIDRGGDAQ